MSEKQKAVHKLKRTSKYSFSVTLPKEMIEKYGWKEKQKLNITDKGHGKIEISDWRRK
jgi:bifunctional DNA-binding transcriptional regulator/antitoxin component of YhaV-PrlF toxin-antitoxin module